MHLILKSSSQDFLGRQIAPQRLLLLCITAHSLAFSLSSSLTAFCFTFGILVTSTKWLGGQEVNWLPHMLLPLLVTVFRLWGRGAEGCGSVCVCERGMRRHGEGQWEVTRTQGKISLKFSFYPRLWWFLPRHSPPLFENSWGLLQVSC